MLQIGKDKKIACAMSGGVDSAVSAALLKQAGYNVIGVFMRLWSEEEQSSKIADENRAKATAEKIDIPFYVYDLSKEFKNKVVDYFLEEFNKGRTPNPCVVCNQKIKFGILLEKALKLNADFIATGHYAQIKAKNHKARLFEGKDKTKDQSYFLWQLKQKQLQKIIFPLGAYYKKNVKQMAKNFDLPAQKALESKEICFIPDSLADFLSRYLNSVPGKIVNSQGKEIGEHKGLLFYTIGQRKGIDLPGGPFYVLKKDLNNNQLVVTKNEKELLQKEIKLKQVNWTIGQVPDLPLKMRVRIRYRHQAIPAQIFKKSNLYNLQFKTKQKAITPGQSAVFYKRKEVLGGGVIN